MITRDELRSIPDLHKSIQRDREQLRFLQEKATAVPSGISDHERVQISPGNKAGKYVDAAVDLAAEIHVREMELIRLQCGVREIISTVGDPLARKILRYRYLRCYSWAEIADLTGYTERHVRRMETEILKNVLPCPPMSGV